MNRWVVIVALLTGCTVVGGIAGGAIAHGKNGDGVPAHHVDVANAVVLGAVIGLAVDVATILIVASQLKFDVDYCGANGCDGY
jgi:hypothetical protein